MPEKRCTAITKAGKPCKGTPISATDFETCVSHAPEEVRAKLGFGGPVNGAKGGEARRHPRFTEMLRDQVAAEVEDFLAPYREGLQAVQPVVVGTGPEARLELVPDSKTRMAAMDKILDRLEGKPRQAMELTGEGGGPIETRELLPGDADFHAETAKVLEEAEAITAKS